MNFSTGFRSASLIGVLFVSLSACDRDQVSDQQSERMGEAIPHRAPGYRGTTTTGSTGATGSEDLTAGAGGTITTPPGVVQTPGPRPVPKAE